MRSGAALITVVVRLVGKASNFLVFILLARTLSVEDFGRFGYIFAGALLISAAADLGMRNSGALMIGRNRERPAPWISAVTYTTALSGLLGAVASVLVARLTPPLRDHAELQIPFAVATLGMLAMRTFGGIPLGLGRVSAFNGGEIVARGTFLFLVGLAVITKSMTVATAVLALGISQLAAGLYMLASAGRGALSLPTDLWNAVRELVSRGFPFMLSVLAMSASKRVGVLVVARLGESATLGHYYGMQRLAEILTEVAQAVAVVIFAQNVRTVTKEDAFEQTAVSVRTTAALIGGLAFAGVVLAGPGLSVVLGRGYAGSEMLCRILLISTFISSYSILLFPSMAVLASPARMLALMLPTLALNVLLVWIGFSLGGVIGAATCDLVSNVVTSWVFLRAFSAGHKQGIRAVLWPTTGEMRELFHHLPWRRAPQ